jgi:hypothetical protein
LLAKNRGVLNSSFLYFLKRREKLKLKQNKVVQVKVEIVKGQAVIEQGNPEIDQGKARKHQGNAENL